MKQKNPSKLLDEENLIFRPITFKCPFYNDKNHEGLTETGTAHSMEKKMTITVPEKVLMAYLLDKDFKQLP